MNSGIYSIKNHLNGRIYVGSTKCLSKRKSCHWSKLKIGKHDNPYLQADWRKCGEKAFTYEILEYVEEQFIIEREQYWLDKFWDQQKQCYNIRKIADRNTGIFFSEDTKKKLSASHIGQTSSRKGVTLSEETKRKIAASLKGRGPNKETIEKIKKTLKGRIINENQKRALINLSESRKKIILQFDKSNEKIIKEYSCAAEASKITGINRTAIVQCLKNRSKTAGGFIWRYK